MADNPLQFLVRKLRLRSAFSADAEAALIALAHTRKFYPPAAYLVREGSTHLSHCGIIVSGYAFRQKVTTDGLRQIVALNMRGDMLDLQHLFLGRADHNVQALSELEIVNVDRGELRQAMDQHPDLARAMWTEALVEASTFREWIVNVGRRDARARVAHLLCEFAVRQVTAGLSEHYTCQLPMTQEQIGDATGLTSVHVNRTLKALEQQGAIKRVGRSVSFDDWDRLRTAAGFSALYLHLDNADEIGPD